MSVVVRMKMPENCFPCSTKINPEERQCNIDGHIFEETLDKLLYGRDINCPIVCQLPEGHGRLVDADKEIDFHVNDFERLIAEDIDVYSKAYSLSDLCDGITYAYDHANIIIPAEAERRET